MNKVSFSRHHNPVRIALAGLLLALTSAGSVHAFDAVPVDARSAAMSPYRALGRLTVDSRLKSDRDALAVAAAMPVDGAPADPCTGKRQAFCRDLAATELRITSLYFMLPEVPGLTPQRLNIRRNSVSVTYSFR